MSEPFEHDDVLAQAAAWREAMAAAKRDVEVHGNAIPPGNVVNVSGHSYKILAKARRFVAEDVDDLRFSFVGKGEKRKKSKRDRRTFRRSDIRWQRYGWWQEDDPDRWRWRPPSQRRPDAARPWLKAKSDPKQDRPAGDGWTPVNF